MKIFSRIATIAIGQFIFISLLHSPVLANKPQALQQYRSDIIPGIQGAPAKYLQATVPADFSSGDILSLKIVFISPNQQTNIVGYIEQTYTIQQAYVQDSYASTYTLSKTGSLNYSGKPGIAGLVDNMVLKNTKSFQFVMNPALVDDLGLNYSNSVGDIAQFPLTYAGLAQDKDASTQAQKGSSSGNIYDKLLSDDSKEVKQAPKAPRSNKNLFGLDFEVDIDALLNKREYNVFVLNTNKPKERDGHVVLVGYYIPINIKEGSLLRVLALKKDPSTAELIGSIEFNYYVKEIVVENDRKMYMLTDLAKISTKTGESIDLFPIEEEAFKQAKSISIMEGDGLKILGIQHGDGGSAAVFEGTFSF